VGLGREVGGADIAGAGALLMIEADGDDGTLPHVVAALERAARGDGLVELAAATDPAANETLWAARRALSPALRTIAVGKINEDVVVPVSRLPALVAGIRSEERRVGKE